jgi:hypothetical protein
MQRKKHHSAAPGSAPLSPQQLADSDIDDDTAALLREVEALVRDGKIKAEVYHALRQMHARNAKILRAVVLPPGRLHMILGFRSEGVIVEKIQDGSCVTGLLHEGNVLRSVCGVDIANLKPRAVQQLLTDHQSEHRTVVVLKDEGMEARIEVANMSTTGRSFDDLKTNSRLLEVKELSDAGKVDPEMYSKLKRLNTPSPKK